MSSFRAHPGFSIAGEAVGVAGTSSRDDRSEASRARFTLPPPFPSGRGAFSTSAPSLPFASLSSSILSGLGKAGKAPNTVVEHHTGIEYPTEFCFRTKTNCPSLTGLGVRSKVLVIAKVNVYALGIYVDATAAKKALARPRYVAQDVAAVAKDQQLFDDVIAADGFEKTLRLVISSGLVSRKKFVDALEEQLKPRLAKAGHPELLSQFSSQFGTITFHKGMEVAFSQTADKLGISIDGKQVGAIQSCVLCRALFDIYLGKDPVSKDAKETFGKSLAAVLKQ